MAEEDEIDVLGDFSTDCLNLLPRDERRSVYDSSTLMSQGSDILSLNDYTIHPQWLLDKPSTNPACWYNAGTEFGLNFEQTNPVPTEVTTESITDESGWTEKEKDLIKRGIEIFGKSHIRLSQFIGSRTPAEVRYFLKNFYSYIEKPSTVQDEIVFDNCLEEAVPNSEVSTSIDYTEVLDDTEIPASMEEVIAAVSTATPTVSTNKRSKKKSVSFEEYNLNYENIPSGQSLLKSNYPQYSSKENIKTNRNNFINPKEKIKRQGHVLSKKFPKPPIKMKVSGVKFKANLSIPKNLQKPAVQRKRRKSSKSVSESSDSSTVPIVASDVSLSTGNGLSVPVCDGEVIVKISKSENSGSDEDIDIEDLDDSMGNVVTNNNETCDNIKQVSEDSSNDLVTSSSIIVNNITDNKIEEVEKVENFEQDRNKNLAPVLKKRPDISKVDPEVVELLNDMSFPSREVKLTDDISELEKFIHFEFFEGRPTKTPARYLKIRNHIINAWNSSRPTYVTKTSVRNGLKQCGDVNCIGRIHSFLEQVGAINFGCPQTSYIRPLYELVILNNAAKEKNSKDIVTEVQKDKDLAVRPRFRKKYLNDGEGGCTYLHDERGEVINTTVISEEPVIKKNNVKKPSIRLIYCRPFNEDNPQKYSVRIDLSVILLMDLHAHMSLNEVMGLVGGYWDKERRKLYITRYEPCRNIASSSTHCDMCPVSQDKAAQKFHRSGLNILGWFHSHPTFAPEPSQQDIDTQLSVQQWIGSNTPCVGIILSPFSGHGALIASPFRCMIVDNKRNFDDQYAPYKFKVELDSGSLRVGQFLQRAREVYESDIIAKENRVDFSKLYFQDDEITHLEKFLTSIKMHLAKCSNVNKMTCDDVIEGITEICSNN